MSLITEAFINLRVLWNFPVVMEVSLFLNDCNFLCLYVFVYEARNAPICVMIEEPSGNDREHFCMYKHFLITLKIIPTQ